MSVSMEVEMLAPRMYFVFWDGKAGILSAVIDLGKGLLAAGVIATLRLDSLPYGYEFWQVETLVRAMAGGAAIVGHMFPLWARFHGGKGVNTAAGVLFAFTPLTMGIVLGVFVVVLLVSRYVSVASISAAAMFPTTIAIRKYIFDIEGLDAGFAHFRRRARGGDCTSAPVQYRPTDQRHRKQNSPVPTCPWHVWPR